MTKLKFSMTPEALELKREIGEWRKNKTTRGMPEALWLKAAAEAQKFSPSSVAEFLKLRVDHLRRRLPYTASPVRQIKKKDSGFVELPSLPLMTPLGLEFHVVGRGGQSGTVRGLQSGSDWEAVFSGWLKASMAFQEGGLR
jgi:hypothetical protein